ncbi:MAG: sigma-70 family RNA polymerase sigma factor [Clostridia bacterium]|nr:sigma-70 family RNA polymerase sigma factor [Clostridia bacterium]
MQSYEQNNELIKRAQNGDENAKDLLIQQNYPLVKSIIRRYVGKGVDYDDLFQLGCVGFVKAINNFDTSFDVKFSTYAVPMIAGEVKRFLRDDGYIKVSRAIKTMSLQIKEYIKNCEQSLLPTDIESIAKHFNTDPQEIVFALDASKYPISIFASCDQDGEEGATISEKIKDEIDEAQRLDHLVLKEMIKNLAPKEQKVIILRYYRDKTQSEVAKILGVSQVQVSRIENKILQSFKHNLTA